MRALIASVAALALTSPALAQSVVPMTHSESHAHSYGEMNANTTEREADSAIQFCRSGRIDVILEAATLGYRLGEKIGQMEEMKLLRARPVEQLSADDKEKLRRLDEGQARFTKHLSDYRLYKEACDLILSSPAK